LKKDLTPFFEKSPIFLYNKTKLLKYFVPLKQRLPLQMELSENIKRKNK